MRLCRFGSEDAPRVGFYDDRGRFTYAFIGKT